MSNRSYSCIYLHIVWTTKHRKPFLQPDWRWELFEHIREEAHRKGYYIDMINGVDDHVHVLVGLNPVHSVSKMIKDIKGESSRWINDQEFLDVQFAWQRGYAVFSVSPGAVKIVRDYIKNQQMHHKERSWEEEMRELRKHL